MLHIANMTFNTVPTVFDYSKYFDKSLKETVMN